MGVGRRTAQKAFDVLIPAFAQVRKRQCARLLILGEGEDRKALEEVVERHGLAGDVSLHGFAPNPYSFMARACTFALSSRWEGLPTVLIEAMSLGIPVVSTDCPSGPREILRDGRYGRLVAVDDVDSLAKAISAAVNGEVAPPPPESWLPFDMDTVIDQYVHIMTGR